MLPRKIVLIVLAAAALVATAVVVELSSVVAAQSYRCSDELARDLDDGALSAAADGLWAARLLRHAVELVEPALPELVFRSDLPLQPGDSGYDTVRWLAERRLLPTSWRPDAIDRGTWQRMIGSFTNWYRLEPIQVSEPTTVRGLIEDLSRALDAVSEAIRPAALIASDPSDHERVSFWAIIWNWTIYPRLLVLKPQQDVTLQRGIRSVLPLMSNCAVEITDFVFAPQETAKRLFLATNESRMIIAESNPERDAWPLVVPEGEETSYFAFEEPDLAGVDLYAAVFDGPSAGLGTILSLLPRVRTNMSPNRFFSYLKTPWN